MKAYKGFNKDMTCRGFQFEEGKTYHEENADLCHSGFHACENPLDCFGYYAPGQSVFHEVELDDVSDQRGDDSKICGKTIKIGAELDVAKICKLHFEYVKERCNPVDGRVGGDRESVSVGEKSSASAGESGSASAGWKGSASAGAYGSASAGSYGSSSAGKYGRSVSGGSSSVGESGVAVAKGNGCRVKGGMGALLVCAEENTDNYAIETWAAGIVDGEKIKPDTWYKVENGEFVEVGENE